MQISIIVRQYKKSVPVIFYLSILFSSLMSCAIQKDSEWDPAKLDLSADDSVLNSTDVDLPAAIKPLIQQADDFIQHKQWTQAVSVLERALRINKRQAETWSRMAVAYTGNDEFEQAIHMARRSNSYAAEKVKLQAYNWQIISHAYLKLNKLDQAQSAAVKRQQLLDNH